MKMSSQEDVEEIVRSSRDAQPSHYIYKIKSFSSLLKSSVTSIPSPRVFESGGYKWRLDLHPNGNKAMYVKDHVSLYLVITNTESLPSGWEVNVFFRFFLFDQIRDKYDTFEGIRGKYRRFHALKTEWGFSHLIPHTALKNSGYMVDDTCVFGAEVFVCQKSANVDCLSMVEDKPTITYTWKIENFSQLDDGTHISPVFSSGEERWNISIHPKGDPRASTRALCVFLECVESTSVPKIDKLFLQYGFRLKNQECGKDVEVNMLSWHFDVTGQTGWGTRSLINLDVLNNPTEGFLVNDTCIIQAFFTVRGVVNQLS